ncbi:hypothetical protein [Rosenbergiella nectarea]|uniref:hypothetical protein n=1 Tax=Rosenbergiella nectarea TaxID=988801 RepID=UPI001F4DF495|nr:hypothetical protein [Rosenbergiella nectarea]
MKKTHSDRNDQKLYSATEVFTQMGVAMDMLLQASPAMLKDCTFEGHEITGKQKQKQRNQAA